MVIFTGHAWIAHNPAAVKCSRAGQQLHGATGQPPRSRSLDLFCLTAHFDPSVLPYWFPNHNYLTAHLGLIFRMVISIKKHMDRRRREKSTRQNQATCTYLASNTLMNAPKKKVLQRQARLYLYLSCPVPQLNRILLYMKSRPAFEKKRKR